MHSKPPQISDGMRAKFQAIATETAELVPPSAYANYVIIDPTTADPERILPGAAIYVGQTSELRSRIRSHLRQAIRPAPEHAQLYHYMARLISRGAWPVFRVLETHTNRVDCMLAETVWAQRLLRSGARLFNTWPEQSKLLTASSLRRMQRVFPVWAAVASKAKRHGHGVFPQACLSVGGALAACRSAPAHNSYS